MLTDYAETARAVLAGYAVICLGVVAMWRLWPRVARLLTSLIWVLSIPQAVYAMLPFVMAGGHEFADRPNASDVATMGYTVLFFVMGAAVVLLILGQFVLWRRHR